MLISVIIPVYNAEEFIVDTLNSVINQDFKNIEVVVIDDGSKDKSKQIIENFIKENPSIELISIPNGGVSNARNLGLQKANGDYVLFLDADDILNTSFISNKMENIHRGDDVICSYVTSFRDSMDNILNKKHSIYENVTENVLNFNGGMTIPSSYLIKRDFLIKNEIKFNTKLSSTADRFFLIECDLKKGIFSIEPKQNESTIYYRISDNSMSYKLTTKLVDDNAKYVKELKLILNSNYNDLIYKNWISVLKSYLKIFEFKEAVNFSFAYFKS